MSIFVLILKWFESWYAYAKIIFFYQENNETGLENVIDKVATFK